MGGGVFPPPFLKSAFVEFAMTAYVVRACTVGKFIPRGVAWEPDNFAGWFLSDDCVFENADVVFKPFSEAKLPGLMGDLSRGGCWGFRRDGYIVVFEGSNVTCHG